MNDMTPEQQGAEDSKAALLAATQAPKGKTLKAWDPLKRIPTLGIDDLEVGKTIYGSYVRREEIPTPNSLYAITNSEGMKVTRRFILRNDAGTEFGIWSVGQLGLIFSNTQPGEFVALTYKGKLPNKDGQQVHTFEVQKESSH